MFIQNYHHTQASYAGVADRHCCLSILLTMSFNGNLFVNAGAIVQGCLLIPDSPFYRIWVQGCFLIPDSPFYPIWKGNVVFLNLYKRRMPGMSLKV
ncbi:hypothetical protein HanXRQr2_Chr12g0551601 [Helianthus annuus]|uniref:Uncharacterized protein n=1 Tax=Helianthus annuus TaxID=4232 RepID=A0A9K3HI63_HELAN|nr:hypothetical protein HanXRQr2_Chr12g0551601 [Helianthus annuus]KAJ0863521.1 hypothetical protein HanPSC8_Chr12g0531041 [Helianthus annuus]